LNKLEFNTDSITIAEAETTFDLVNGESIIMSISENDALWNNSTKQELAKKYKILINTAIIKYKTETSVTTLAKEIGLALLVLILMFVLISYLKSCFIGPLLKSNCKKRGIKSELYFI
jgi:hypothetical protein